jgi:xanthine dehydrogenase accessory factor
MKVENGVYAEAHRLEEKGEAFALAFIIESTGSVPRQSGRMIVRIDGTTLGTVGGGPLEVQVIQEAREALAEGRSRTVDRRLTPSGESAAGMECGGAVAVRIDVTAAPPRMLLIGGGHVNLAVARAAATLGFAVEVVETRRDFCSPERFPMARRFYLDEDLIAALNQVEIDDNTYILIATSDDDIRALNAIIGSQPAYLGMLGSKRKVAVAVAGLRERGISEGDISSLRAPVGLDIGAQTPQEIAVSIMAEILKLKSGRTGLPLQGMTKDLVVIRGAGDLATGIAWRLKRCGFRVIMLDLPEPTVIRRTVAFAAALLQDSIVVEGIEARRAVDIPEAYQILENGAVPVLADPRGESLATFKPAVVVDAILAKRNLGTIRQMAPIVVAVGPGFTAGEEGDCHAVVETDRGHELGRVILDGAAHPNTGTPGLIGGKSAERVLRAPLAGIFSEVVSLGDVVKKGDVVARVYPEDDSSPGDILAPFDGKVRGLLSSGQSVKKGFKVGDVDPRGEEVDETLISDKARAVAGGVLEAILLLRSRAAAQ